MIKDGMIEELQELKLSGYSFPEARDELRRRHMKVPCEKTLRKYYNMEAVPDDSHAKVRKGHAFDEEPFRSEILCILEMNPGCYMSSVYDVLIEEFVESGRYEILPGNEQTLRNYIRYLRESGQVEAKEERRRLYDVMPTPDPGKKAQIDFGQYDCGDGLVVHFICIVQRHFEPPVPTTVLCGDITYLWTLEGWLYMATVIDLATRMVVGLSFSDRMTADLPIAALASAWGRGFIAGGAIFHSDRGSQYTSKAMADWALAHGIRLSVGRTGSCHDNAVAEGLCAQAHNGSVAPLSMQLPFRDMLCTMPASSSLPHHSACWYCQPMSECSIGLAPSGFLDTSWPGSSCCCAMCV